MPPRFRGSSLRSGVRLVTVFWFRLIVLGLRLVDGPKTARLDADRFHLDDAPVFGLDAVAARCDLCARSKQCGDLICLLGADAQDRAICEKRPAQLALGTEQR
jgi:hypothetical protein